MEELIEVRINNERIFSFQPEWVADIEAFIMSMLDHFYIERESELPQVYISWLERLTYSWLRSIRFVKKLPEIIIVDSPVISLIRFRSEFQIDLLSYKDKGRDEWIKWGGDLREFFRA